VLKRGIDVAMAALMLLLCLPLLVVCAILIKIDSGGPVLFRQARMGRGFGTFTLLKLRTMRDGGQGPAFTLGPDARITRAGRWLRRWKLDELPQLWNVVRGEMSLVGPRPVIPELAFEFAQDYAVLLRVRPGLTDPATVRYCREAEILSAVADPLQHFKTVVTPDKLRISRQYVQQATIGQDFAVLFKTALALMSPVQPRVPAPGSQRLLQPVSPVSSNQD
jgi:lipopolysaccharide/colanic/teichoic acid biosynthesis glycosyltransferase